MRFNQGVKRLTYQNERVFIKLMLIKICLIFDRQCCEHSVTNFAETDV